MNASYEYVQMQTRVRNGSDSEIACITIGSGESGRVTRVTVGTPSDRWVICSKVVEPPQASLKVVVADADAVRWERIQAVAVPVGQRRRLSV